jgi:hypothetical protein
MAAPAPARIREFRCLIGTTFNLTHTNAADVTWAAGTARKPKIISLDASGLEYASEEDPTLYPQHCVSPANIATTRTGNVNFGMWLAGGITAGTANEEATLLECCLGGIEAGAATDAADSTGVHTDIKVYAADIDDNLSVGQGVMVGVKGDGDGGGEARVCSSATAASDFFETTLAFPGTIVDGAQIRIGTTVFYDPTATQKYIDTLMLGYSAEDQLQTIGGAMTFDLEGLAMGELPKINFAVQAADWQEVPSAERDALAPTTAADGGTPAQLRGTGVMRISDNGTSTIANTAFKVSDVSITPNLVYEPVNGMNGINGIEAWQKVSFRPVIEFNVLLEGNADPLPGFYDDFVAGTAKMLHVQFGSTSTAACLIDFPRAYFTAAPTRTTVGSLQAVKCSLHGGGLPPTTAESTANYLANSPMRIHFF